MSPTIPILEDSTVFLGKVGSGKTQALRIIAQQNPGALYLSIEDGPHALQRVKAMAPQTVFLEAPLSVLLDAEALREAVAGKPIVLIDGLSYLYSPMTGRDSMTKIRIVLKEAGVRMAATLQASRRSPPQLPSGLRSVFDAAWAFEGTLQMRCVKGQSMGKIMALPFPTRSISANI